MYPCLHKKRHTLTIVQPYLRITSCLFACFIATNCVSLFSSIFFSILTFCLLSIPPYSIPISDKQPLFRLITFLIFQLLFFPIIYTASSFDRLIPISLHNFSSPCPEHPTGFNHIPIISSLTHRRAGSPRRCPISCEIKLAEK